MLGLIKYHSLNSIFSWEKLAFDDLLGLTFCGNIHINSSLSSVRILAICSAVLHSSLNYAPYVGHAFNTRTQVVSHLCNFDIPESTQPRVRNGITSSRDYS